MAPGEVFFRCSIGIMLAYAKQWGIQATGSYFAYLRSRLDDLPEESRAEALELLGLVDT